ncbi:hypothetical protein QYF61_001633 [Mycteria americana]|uniref:Uncharacterized protein n=1 Tax=Mycteria americana TaxID=33587 RepID=A0AAN7S579_MYCAM|nr:hypothetical protein QYF61_001633 [Mycteria americana]
MFQYLKCGYKEDGDSRFTRGHMEKTRGSCSNLTLNASRDGASTTSLDNLVQCLTTLITPFKYWKAAIRSPHSLLFSRLNNPNSQLVLFSSSRTLSFLTPSLHKQAVSLYSFQVTHPCFHCLCSSLLLFSLTSMSRLSHASLFPSLPDFLHLGTESSCALWKASLKICQLCSAPLSLRTISQGVLLTNSLNSWKFAFLKFRVLTIVLACPISLRTATVETDRSLREVSGGSPLQGPGCVSASRSSRALAVPSSPQAPSPRCRSLPACLRQHPGKFFHGSLPGMSQALPVLYTVSHNSRASTKIKERGALLGYLFKRKTTYIDEKLASKRIN